MIRPQNKTKTKTLYGETTLLVKLEKKTTVNKMFYYCNTSKIHVKRWYFLLVSLNNNLKNC